MKKWEKEILQNQINNEASITNRIEIVYKNALKTINDKILVLQSKEQTQSVIYQLKYQQQLKAEVGDVYSKMASTWYQTIDEYLNDCYEDSFYSTMYALHQEGIPVVIPFNQKEVAQAAAQDFTVMGNKLSQKLYVDAYDTAKKTVQQISKGLAMNSSYATISAEIAKTGAATVNQALRIVRTESHRIHEEVKFKTVNQVKDKGADIVKQWDSTIDKRTRSSHAALDGQLREIEQPFKSPTNGHTALYPGGFGIASEDINCRCVVLQRARWALDQSELEKHVGDLTGMTEDQLDELATKFGVSKEELIKKSNGVIESDGSINHRIKAQNYNQFKKKYQKKADVQKAKLQSQLDVAQQEYDSIMSKYKDMEDLMINGNYGDLDKIDILNDLIGDLEKQIGITPEIKAAKEAEKLAKEAEKKAAEEAEKLKKLQDAVEAAQAKVDAVPNKTYTGIWKDDVSLSDYELKKDSIQKKKDYYLQKLGSGGLTQAESDKYWKYINDLDEFEIEGSKYSILKKELDDAARDYNDFKRSISGISNEAFTDERKKAAKWFDRSHGGFNAADKYFDPQAKKIHSSATSKEQNGFYTYTSGSGGHNRPLAGFEKPWTKSGTGWENQYFKGSGNVWIDFEGKGEQIRGLTTLIEKSTYPDDVWLQSGQGFGTIEGVLGLPRNTLSKMSDSELQQFVGRRFQFNQFISTAVNEGGGSMFNAKPLKMNIYAPQGSQMLYASDVGAFGKGENEMILQRGGTYEITKIYWGTDNTDGGKYKIFVDLDLHSEEGYNLFQQDPNEWKGSRKTYRD